MRMFHGSSSPVLALHEGLCLTDDDDRARDYAAAAFGAHWLHEVSLDLDGLVVIDVEDGWDRDEAVAAGDHGDVPGADVLVYQDESPHNHRHCTWRLMTPAALAAVTPAGTAGLDA